MKIARIMALAVAVLAGAAGLARAELPVLRVAVLEFGTVRWELDTIARHGLDTANGFEMAVQGVAGSSAGQVAFQGGAADVIVSDWIWVARQRAAGRDYMFLPYSRAVGGLMLPPGSDAASLADLAGTTIGIAGGPLDKSWLILRAYAFKTLGLDIAGETDQVFGAPPLIFKAALDGEVAGAVTYWHIMAKMKAAGMTELVSVADAAEALGLDPDTPLLGYVVKGDLVRDKPDLVAGLARASREAKRLMREDDAEWERLRPMMRVETEAEFAALREGYRAGIPTAASVDPVAAQRFFEVMVEFGGAELTGTATSVPEGIFLDAGG